MSANANVGAGSARPNISTYVFVGAFGQANPAPTGIWQNTDIIHIEINMNLRESALICVSETYYSSLMLIATPPLGARRCFSTVLLETFLVEMT